MYKLPRRCNDAVHWYMSELTSRVVAKSGIPSDRHHLGKLVLQSLKDAPDFVLQIDGATDESETNRSILSRSIRCAVSFRNMGLKQGDVMVLIAPNHLDLTIPFYAALYLGIMISAVDKTLGVKELKETFDVTKPKIIFCQSEKAPDIQLALNEIDLDAQIVTFDKGDYLCSFSEFMDKYGDDTSVEEFTPTDFDPEDTIAFLIATSGTTGLPKSSASTHKNCAITIAYLWINYTQFPTPTRLIMLFSPLQWLTALITYLATAVLRYTRLQSSLPLTVEHSYHLINKYKPTYTVLSPTLMTTLIDPRYRDRCDFTSFETILLGGSAVSQELIQELKKITPQTEVCNVYGMSELNGIVFQFDYPAPGSSGKPMGCLQYRLINIETNEDIYEPNVPGELWMQGPSVFKEYYNNPEATKETFAEGGWFKTGDIFYRDENWNYFFVERIKLLLKYRNNQISPVEVENVIRQHPGVMDVAVTGIPEPECGELPVACVVPHSGYQLTAQEIKDLVKEHLTDSKQLRGGVIFMNQLPITSTSKVHRRNLKEMVLQMKRE